MLILPLSILLALEASVAALLCIPLKHITKFALLITGVFRKQAVKIILGTCGAILTMILVFSCVRMKHLREVMTRPVSSAGAASVFHEARQELYSEGIQSCLIVSILLLGMCIISLDNILRRNKALQNNFDTMMKQAKGTQEEYMRQLEKKDTVAAPVPTASGTDEALAPLKKQNVTLKDENERLQRDVRAADASVAAIKKQTEGLQLEFNRLLEENESLRQQLAIFDRKYSKGDEKKRT